MDLTQEVKDLALKQLGMTVCGIAPVSRFEAAPKGKRPEDLLPGAKSVIVLGVRLLDGAMQAIFRKYEEGRRNAHGIYATYASTIAPNLQMAYAVFALTNYIEEKTGAVAVPTTSGPFQATSSFSQRRAAVAAGLGQYSWSGYVVNEKYGPRMRYGSIITTLELAPDPLYPGPQLCDPSKCRVCVERCPAHALSEYPEAVTETVGGQPQQRAALNVPRCRAACFGLVKETANSTSAYGKEERRDLVELECLTDEGFMAGIHTLEKSLSGLQLYPNWKCSLCLAYCPLGDWQARFGDTGLSRGSYDPNVRQADFIQHDVQKDGAK